MEPTGRKLFLKRLFWSLVPGGIAVALVCCGCSRGREVRISVEMRNTGNDSALVEINGSPKGYQPSGTRDFVLETQEGGEVTVAATLDSVVYQRVHIGPDEVYALKFDFGRFEPIATTVGKGSDSTTKTSDSSKQSGGPTLPIPVLSVPDHLVFTPTNTSEEHDAELALSNTGSGKLIVTSISIEGDNAAEFRVQGQTRFSLAASKMEHIRIRFAPLADGVRSARLKIASNDDNGSPLVVSLSGEGKSIPVENDLATLLKAGTQSYEAGDYHAAERTCSRVLGVNEYDPDAYFLRARSRQTMGNYDAAVRDFIKFHAYRTQVRNHDDIDRLTCEALYYKAMAATSAWQKTESGEDGSTRRKEAANFWKDYLGMNVCSSDHRMVENAKTMLQQLEGGQ